MPVRTALLPSELGLCFSGAAAPRDLHSFPTRRSSDLARLRAVLRRAGPPGTPVVAFGDVAIDFDKSEVTVDGRHVDRKSTRLNSSHVAISYAVFCLKKKKNQSGIRQSRSTL